MSKEVELLIPAAGVKLAGNLMLPDNGSGIVIFAHGSGSSRFSPRNRLVAAELQTAGLATLLMDLLPNGEEAVDDTTAEYRFDIPLLAARVVEAIDWATEYPSTREFKIGLFGASTGAAAALVAAADRVERVAAVVSRGGRPDLAGEVLPRVKAPTLLVVGGEDIPVIRMNRDALDQLRCEKRMQVVPGASHLFEQPGTLEEVARLAKEWLVQYLTRRGGNSQAA